MTADSRQKKTSPGQFYSFSMELLGLQSLEGMTRNKREKLSVWLPTDEEATSVSRFYKVRLLSQNSSFQIARIWNPNLLVNYYKPWHLSRVPQFRGTTQVKWRDPNAPATTWHTIERKHLSWKLSRNFTHSFWSMGRKSWTSEIEPNALAALRSRILRCMAYTNKSVQWERASTSAITKPCNPALCISCFRGSDCKYRSKIRSICLIPYRKFDLSICCRRANLRIIILNVVAPA
jgi:hypothetical protein